MQNNKVCTLKIWVLQNGVYFSTLFLWIGEVVNKAVTLFTCMAWTSLLVSSSAAMAVDVVNELAPRCRPRTIRPSFWYCSMGSQNKSRIPWTRKIIEDRGILELRIYSLLILLIEYGYEICIIYDVKYNPDTKDNSS
jgi:hypothetical protein